MDCTESSTETLLHDIVFAELISYTESYRESVEERPIIKIGDIKNLYHPSYMSLVNDPPVQTTRHATILTYIFLTT